MTMFDRTMQIIDERIANLDRIALSKNVPSTSTDSARLALLDLKMHIEEDAKIGRQIMAVV